jgi:hypothetical protein
MHKKKTKKKSAYKIMKVFDCQDMPENIRQMFFELCESGNDCYVDWTINGTTDEYITDEEKAIDAWLISNGANGAPSEDDSGEDILIRHWW